MIDRLKESFKKPVEILNRHKMKNYAVMIPLVFLNGEYNFLFQKRAKNIRQGGEISFCGGAKDRSDRDFLDTAIRETIEEIGIDRDKIEVLGQIDTMISPRFLIIESFISILHIDSLDELNPNSDEVESLFLLPISFFQNGVKLYKSRTVIQPHYVDENGQKITLFPSKELNLPKKYHQEWGESLNDIFVYESKYGTIWGLTSVLIQEVLRRI